MHAGDTLTDTMKMDFTNEEFAALFDMINLADWILHAHKTGGQDDEYGKLQQKILSHAKDFGLGETVNFQEEFDCYSFTRDYEASEKFEGVIEEYNNQTFWDELIPRLAERDVVRRIGREHFNALPPNVRIELLDEREKFYADEFETNGLASLNVEGGSTSLIGYN